MGSMDGLRAGEEMSAMANMFGADLGDLETLRSTFDRKADEVNALTGGLNAQVAPGATAWSGPGAESFRAAWDGDFRPALVKLESALREASGAVGTYRDNIEAATR
jgi:WXG100 family type VII secretion target